jgi:hypothetical protein
VKLIDELFVGTSIEHQLIARSVKRYFQYSTF